MCAKLCGNKRDTDELILFYAKNDVWDVKITSFFYRRGIRKNKVFMFNENKSER